MHLTVWIPFLEVVRRDVDVALQLGLMRAKTDSPENQGWTVFTFALAGAKSYKALLGLRFMVGLFE